MNMESSTMYWLLYFTLILMRCGDIEVNPGPRNVSDKELIKLSKRIAPGSYDELGVNLGYSLEELAQIKESARDTKDALTKVFCRWRDKQLPDTNIRALLAKALQESELGSLCDDLLTGAPVKTSAPVTIQGSNIQPLCPDLIERCRVELQFKYRTDFCMIRADPLDPDSVVPFKDMYTSLFFQKWKRDKWIKLEYKDLFNLKVNGEFPKRIMIQGEAGAGKTTFMAKLAWDWIHDSPDLSKFVWVLVIPLREAKRYTIGQIVKSYLSKDNPAAACQITEYIRSNPEKVFIACDGLDEFGGNVTQETDTKQGLEDSQPKSKVGSETSPASASLCQRTDPESSVSSFARGDILIEDVLRSDEVRTCPVMVTSRPWKADEIRRNTSLRRLYTFIRVKGFSRENVKVYVSNYFEDTEATADEFIQLFESNDIMSEKLAPYPIYISMLCHMWREIDDTKKEELKSLETFSEIFLEVFEFLKVHYVQKEITDLSSPLFNTRRFEIEKLMEPIAEVAFTGLLSNNLIFNEEDLRQIPDSLKTACNVGVLTQERKKLSIHDRSSAFLQSTTFFPHKLFQEYMAAVYFASLYDSNLNEFKRLFEEVLLPRKEEFNYLLFFTLSQDKNIAKYATKRLSQHCTRSQDNRAITTEINFLVDVAFESRDEDSIAMLRNSVSPLVIDVTDAHTIAGYAFTRIYSNAFEIKLLSFGASYGPGISNDAASIVCSAPCLRNIELRAIFHPNFYKTLAREGRMATVHTLKMESYKSLSSASSHHLVEALCVLPNLRDLTLVRVAGQEDFCSHLNERASICKVRKLRIYNLKSSSPASSHDLVGGICSLPNLTYLELYGDGFQDAFFSALNAKASTLKVETLEVDVHCLSTISSSYLVEALCTMPNLTELNLTHFGTEYLSTLREKASSTQGSFPQINQGHFRYNGLPMKDLQSFLQAITDEIRYYTEMESSSSDESSPVASSSSEEYFDA